MNIHKDDLLRQGSLIGEKIGFEKGVADGINKGARQKALQDAGNLKHLGVAIDIIVQAIGLSKQEVEDI